ncbi:uncharacterized protein [Solanum lycopersicum]|uniref:uncharacterized protein n=1 Tax=Solanum lycopersicum TaxID=4081 RepID=UPI0002BC9EC3|nr:uncharacterized protein LOC101254115 [Solanum lycopersicum]
MYPSTFTGSKTSNNPQEFVDEVNKILVAMGATDTEKAELDYYKLKIRDEMSRFFTKITGDLEQECRDVMLHNNMDLSRLMVHVQQVEDSQKKSGVRNARRPKPHDQACCRSGSNRNNFCIREQPKFKRGQQSSRNSNFQRSTTPRGRPEPKKRNRDEMQHPRKDCAKCGRDHSGECRQGTNAFFGCGKSGHMVKDCPQNRGQTRGNAQPKPNS